MDLYNHLMGGSKKRLQGIATKKEAMRLVINIMKINQIIEENC